MYNYTIFTLGQPKAGDHYIPVALHRFLDAPLKNSLDTDAIVEEARLELGYACLIPTGIYYYGKTYKKKA